MRKFIASVLAALGISGAASAHAPTVSPSAMSSDLRAMVFNLSPKEIGITPNSFHQRVWGIVMETGLRSGYYTLVALADGTTSLYYSTGGGIIGAGEHASVRAASTQFIESANSFAEHAKPVGSHPPPSQGNTVFYLLTFNGVLSYTAPEQALGEHRDSFSGLFYAGQAVITELRKLQQSKV